MKRCKYCKTNKDLKQFTTSEKENYYICIDCLHKQTREGNNNNNETSIKNH